MTDISEIFDIPKTEEEPKKEEESKKEEVKTEEPKEQLKPVKVKKARKPLTAERKEQLKEQLKRGREKSRISRMKAAQDNKKVKKQLLNTDLEGEIKKLQLQISNMTLKNEPVKEIKKEIEIKKIEIKPEVKVKPVIKEVVNVRKLGRFDYSKYF